MSLGEAPPLRACEGGFNVDAEVLNAIPEDVPANGALNQFTTSNGIVLKLKPVPPLLIMDAQRSIKEPVPPKLPNYDKGDGDDAPLEENPNDPTYMREMAAYQSQVGELSNAIFMTRGVEVVSVPEGIDNIDDEGWAEDVKEFTNLDIPKVGKRRMYCWLKYVALTSLDDFQGLLNKLTSLGGVTLESDVSQAQASFRPDTNGDAANGVRAGEEV